MSDQNVNVVNTPETANTPAVTENTVPQVDYTIDDFVGQLAVEESINERMKAIREDRDTCYQMLFKIGKQLIEKKPMYKSLILAKLGDKKEGGKKRGRKKGSKNKGATPAPETTTPPTPIVATVS